MSRRLWPVFLSACLCVPFAVHAQAVFDTIDTDGDGFVSRAEMDAARLERFMALDRNGDGQVDRSELMVGPGQGRKGYTAEQTQAVLASYDHDGDGIITLEEVTEAIERLNVFSGLDTDGDGTLTREEAAGVLDIRPRGGINRDQILSDLEQGKRTKAGFRPVEKQIVLDPFEQARLDASGNPTVPADLLNPRSNGWEQPSVWNNPTTPGMVTIQGGVPVPQSGPQSRDGYVARMVEPMRMGTMNPTLPGAVPPGPSRSTPLRLQTPLATPLQAVPVARASGQNWREVDIGPDGQPLN